MPFSHGRRESRASPLHEWRGSAGAWSRGPLWGCDREGAHKHADIRRVASRCGVTSIGKPTEPVPPSAGAGGKDRTPINADKNKAQPPRHVLKLIQERQEKTNHKTIGPVLGLSGGAKIEILAPFLFAARHSLHLSSLASRLSQYTVHPSPFTLHPSPFTRRSRASSARQKCANASPLKTGTSRLSSGT